MSKTQLIVIHEAKDIVAREKGYNDWNELTSSEEQKKPSYWVEKCEMLEKAIDLYGKNQCEIRHELQIEIHNHEASKKKFAAGYRALISEQIAQLRAVSNMNCMISSNHTHRQKNSFAEQFNTVIERLISKMKDEARSGLWKFGDGFESDDLPF